MKEIILAVDKITEEGMEKQKLKLYDQIWSKNCKYEVIKVI